MESEKILYDISVPAEWDESVSIPVRYFDKSSGNHTTGSRSNSLVGHTHPSQSCQVLTLTLWIPGQTLIAATSTATELVKSVCTWAACLQLVPINALLINHVATLSKHIACNT